MNKSHNSLSSQNISVVLQSRQMVTEIRHFDVTDHIWKPFKRVLPGEQKSIPQHMPDGEVLLYVIRCSEDDAFTQVFKTPYDPIVLGCDDEFFGEEEGLSLEAELHRGEEYTVSLRKNEVVRAQMTKITHA